MGMWGERLTPEEENRIIAKLSGIAGAAGVVTAKELKQHDFSRWLATALAKDVGYEGSLQSRVLQRLRDNGRLTMNHGRYRIIG
jgi:hypothetical protein